MAKARGFTGTFGNFSCRSRLQYRAAILPASFLGAVDFGFLGVALVEPDVMAGGQAEGVRYGGASKI
jgi:hypothetical protein